MTRIRLPAFLSILFFLMVIGTAAAQYRPARFFSWDTLPAFPHTSLKGAVAGTHGGVALVAGGIGEGDDLPRADIYALVGRHWRRLPGSLPHPVAFGAAVSTPGGLLCVGGQDGQRCRTEVYRLRYNTGRPAPVIDTLPPLPAPLAAAAAAMVDGVVYVAGGRHIPGGPPTHAFLALDLAKEGTSGFGWQQLPPWNGPPRAAAAAAGQSDGLRNGFFIIGGDAGDRPLADAYHYDPARRQWRRRADIRTNALGILAVKSPTALPVGAASILLFGARHETHTPVLTYYTVTDRWMVADRLPAGARDQLVLPLGRDVLLPLGGSPGHRLSIAPGVPAFGLLNYAVLAAYFLSLLWIGWYFSRRQLDIDDYFKGGGRVPWWAAGLSIFGTVLSAISFMAIPAKTFATDWSYLLYNLGPFYVAPLVILLFLPFYRRLNITTAYEYLERRFNVTIRLLGSLSFVAYQFGRIAIVLYLPAIALNVVTGFDILLCITVVGIVSVVYTMMGGIEGVIWTDVLQVVVLMGGAVLSLGIILWGYEGGPAAMWADAGAARKFNLIDARWNLREPTLFVALMAGLFSNLVFYGTDQTVVQRYLTARDEQGARRSIWTNALLIIPSTLLFFAIGTALFLHYRAQPAEMHPALAMTDAIFPWFIVSELPAGVSGLLIAGVFAASMSSLSSSLNSVASAYTVDVHRRFGLPGSELRVARLSTLLTGILGTAVALAFATSDIKSLWDEFLKVLGLITGGIGGVFVLGFLSRRANGAAALTGLIGSTIVQLFLAGNGTVHLLLFTATGFLSCLLIGYAASRVLPGKAFAREGGAGRL